MTVGISVKTPEGLMTSRVQLLMCSVDLVARALILNMKQFNAKHGCCYCENEGQPLPQHTFTAFCASSTPCTHDSILANASKALRKKRASKLI